MRAVRPARIRTEALYGLITRFGEFLSLKIDSLQKISKPRIRSQTVEVRLDSQIPQLRILGNVGSFE